MPVSEGTVHPVEELIPYDGPYADHVSMTRNPATSDDDLLALAERLREARELFTLGVKEGDPKHMIGSIGGIAADQERNIFLLDAENMEIRAYHSTGAFVRAYGGPGQGPKEFETASVFDRSSDGTLVVGGLGPAKVFAPGFRYRSTIGLGYRSYDVCLKDDQLYVRGYAGDLEQNTDSVEYIQVYATDTIRQTHAFAGEYASPNPMVGGNFAQGFIALTSGPA